MLVTALITIFPAINDITQGAVQTAPSGNTPGTFHRWGRSGANWPFLARMFKSSN